MELLDQTIFLSSLISLIIIGPLVGMYFVLFRSYKKLVQKFIDLEIREKNDAEEIIIDASEKAVHMIESANVMNQKISEEFSVALNQARQEHIAMYQKALERAGADIIDGGRAHLVQLQEDLVKQVGQGQSVILKELEKYKKDKMASIDKEISDLSEKYAKKYLGRALSQSEHEQLVMEALKQAKKENVL